MPAPPSNAQREANQRSMDAAREGTTSRDSSSRAPAGTRGGETSKSSDNGGKSSAPNSKGTSGNDAGRGGHAVREGTPDRAMGLPDSRVSRSIDRNSMPGNVDRQAQYGDGTAKSKAPAQAAPRDDRQASISSLLDTISGKKAPQYDGPARYPQGSFNKNAAMLQHGAYPRSYDPMTGPNLAAKKTPGIVDQRADASYFGDLRAPRQDFTSPEQEAELDRIRDVVSRAADPTAIDPSIPGRLAETRTPGYGVPDVPQLGQTVEKTPGPRVNLPASQPPQLGDINDLLNGIQSGWAENDDLAGLLGDYPSAEGQIYGPASLNSYDGVLDKIQDRVAQSDENAPIPRQNPLSDTSKFTYDRKRPRDSIFAGADQEAISRLVSMQDAYGSPFRITSGYRSPALNAKVDGAEKSQHLQGKAFDVHTDDPSAANYARLAQAAAEAGFTGLGAYRPGSLHVDTGPKRSWGPSEGAVNAAVAGAPPKATVMRNVVEPAIQSIRNMVSPPSVPKPRPKPQRANVNPASYSEVEPGSYDGTVTYNEPKYTGYYGDLKAGGYPRSAAVTNQYSNASNASTIDDNSLQHDMDAADPDAAPEQDTFRRRTRPEQIGDAISEKFRTITDPVQRLIEGIFGTPTGEGRLPALGPGGQGRNPVIATEEGNTDLMTLVAEMHAAGLQQQDQLKLILSVFA